MDAKGISLWRRSGVAEYIQPTRNSLITWRNEINHGVKKEECTSVLVHLILILGTARHSSISFKSNVGSPSILTDAKNS